MKVLLLGGTGLFGKGAATLLARESIITEIGLASRRLESAQEVADIIGAKAHGVSVDFKDVSKLSSIAANYDIIINTAGPTSEVQVPALQAAIEAGVHYCDLGVTGESARRALVLNSQARASGVTAIISTGWFAIMSLMAVHATHQLDTTDELTVCMIADYSPGSYFSPEQSLARARKLGLVETSWDAMETAGRAVLTYQSDHWIQLEPCEHPIEVFHPSGCMITAYLADSTIAVILPASLPGVKTVSTLFSLIPPPLNELWFQQGKRIAIGETDLKGAAMAFFETALSDKERWLSSPSGYPSGWLMWVNSIGYKNGCKAHYTCWPAMILDWTNIPLLIIALRILRGEVPKHGVLLSEECFELDSFLQEAAKYVSEEHYGEPLLNERLDWQKTTAM
jgi:hypothetical protein